PASSATDSRAAGGTVASPWLPSSVVLVCATLSRRGKEGQNRLEPEHRRYDGGREVVGGQSQVARRRAGRAEVVEGECEDGGAHLRPEPVSLPRPPEP